MNSQISKSLWTAFKKAAWAPITVFAIHMLVVQAFHLYIRFPHIDALEHFTGGVVMAYFFYHILSSVRSMVFQPAYATLLQNKIVVLAVTTTAVLWEFCEFILDYTFMIDALRQGTVADTMADIALGMTGAICYLVARRTKKGV